MTTKATNNDFNKDFIQLINSLKDVPKKGKVKYGGTEFTYATLDDILAKVKECDKFALSQPLYMNENGLMVINNILRHISGEVLESGEFPLKDANKMQDLGSIITYTRRYSLSSFLGVMSDDIDLDGQDENGEPVKTKEQEPKQTKKVSTATEVQQKRLLELFADDHDKLEEALSKKGYRTVKQFTVQEASTLIQWKEAKIKETAGEPNDSIQ